VGLSGVTYTVDAFEALQRDNRSFSHVTAYNPFFGNTDYTLTGSGEPQVVAGVMVAGNFFQTLRVEPLHGRLFVREEIVKGGRRAVLLSHAFWRRQFASPPDIVGRTISLDQQAVTVVGILPPSFDFGSIFSPGLRFDLFVPAVMDDIRTFGNTLAIVGRLKPGISVPEAQAEADVLFASLQAAHPEWSDDYSSTVSGLKDHVSGAVRRPLSVLWCAVGLIFLIMCVNLSSLLLSRVSARSQEFAMRSALGASRVRVFRQVLIESVVFTGVGAIIGLGLAVAATQWLAGQGALALPLLERVSVDRAAVLWTVALVAATSLVFGLVSTLRLSTGNLQTVLRSTGRGLTGSHRLERLRATLVITEVTLACVLLIGACLLLRSFLNVLHVDLGFTPDRAAALTIDYDDGNDAGRRGVVLQEIVDAVAAIPGVETAGTTDMLPLGRNRSWGLKAADRTYQHHEGVAALVRIVTPGYLQAMGIRLREGRDFSWSDMTKEPVVIVNEAAARQHWPGRSPVGRLASTTGNGGWTDARVIGVIADVRQQSLEDTVDPEMFLPVWRATPDGARAGRAIGASTVTRRSQRHADAALAQSESAGGHLPSAAGHRRPIGVTETVPRAAGRQLRGAGPAARVPRDLRRHFVFGEATHAGDWRPHGPGGQLDAGQAAGSGAGASSRCRWNRSRHGAIVRRRQGHCVAAVRDCTRGSFDVRHGHRARRDDFPHRGLSARAQSLADRTDVRPPKPVAPIRPVRSPWALSKRAPSAVADPGRCCRASQTRSVSISAVSAAGC
jgi:predicted permease